MGKSNPREILRYKKGSPFNEGKKVIGSSGKIQWGKKGKKGGFFFFWGT